MINKSTYELCISVSPEASTGVVETKRVLLNWLLFNGVTEFVEGFVDGVNVDFDYDNPQRNYYQEHGGDLSPISIFKYERSYLEGLMRKISEEFGDRLNMEIRELDTKAWQEGWKENFAPFSTKKFYICPSWVKPEPPVGRHVIVMDPGMAFGTGQHVTTRLCLQRLEDYAEVHSNDINQSRFLDVGTGSGILAIAASKIGIKNIVATDIDDDAIRAARDNADRNKVPLMLIQGSVPPSVKARPVELVIANILAVVIEKLMSDLAAATAKNGTLILAGLRQSDEQVIKRLAREQSLELIDVNESEGWICPKYVKR